MMEELEKDETYIMQSMHSVSNTDNLVSTTPNKNNT